jgi:hypothetical protein
LALGHPGQLDGGQRGEKRGRIGVGLDAHLLAGHVVDHNGVSALLEQLGAPVFHLVLGFGGEAHNELAGAAPAHHFSQNVLRGLKLQRERPPAFELLL